MVIRVLMLIKSKSRRSCRRTNKLVTTGTRSVPLTWSIPMVLKSFLVADAGGRRICRPWVQPWSGSSPPVSKRGVRLESSWSCGPELKM